MKWEIYNKLTVKQKEEYNFKFKHLELPRINIIYLFIIMLLFVAISMTVLITQKEIIPSSLIITDAFLLLINIMCVMLIVWAGDYVLHMMFYFYSKYKEWKWIKDKVKDIKLIDVIKEY